MNDQISSDKKSQIYNEWEIQSLTQYFLNIENMRTQLWRQYVSLKHGGVRENDPRVTDFKKLDDKLRIAEHKLIVKCLSHYGDKVL